MRVKDLNKVDYIFKASLELIAKEGIAGLTMAKIAKKSKLAIGTLYIYFKNKEVLIHSLYSNLRDNSLNRFMEGVEESTPFKIAIKRIWLNYLNHRMRNYKESVFMEQYYRSPYVSESILAAAQSLKKPVLDTIQKGKDEGFVRKDVDNELLFLAMLGFIRELADEHISGRYILDEAKIQKAFMLSYEMIST